MAPRAKYRVTDHRAPREAADPLIGGFTEEMLHEVVARTPHGETGELAAGWRIEHGRYPAVRLLLNDVPYSMFVEYGTRNMPAEPMLGPVIAAHRAAGAL